MLRKIFICLAGLMNSSICLAAEANSDTILHAHNCCLGLIALVVFAIAYLLVICEEFLHLRKSKPVILASGIIWIIVGIIAKQKGASEIVEIAARKNILEYGELFLFLLVAMTFVNAMEERQVFAALRCWLVNKGLTLRQLFWATGVLAFFISPFADNLTTALLMCAVVLAVGKDNPKFISVACINIVVAANAGGAFSPFGDITTLMVWQKGLLYTEEFFAIFIPAAISFLIPSTIMSFTIPSTKPTAVKENIKVYYGGYIMILLFLITIVITVLGHHQLNLPPVTGMMAGLGLLNLYGYYLRIRAKKHLAKLNNHNIDNGSLNDANDQVTANAQHELNNTHQDELDKLGDIVPFDIMKKVERVEWDTLLFFYGVMLCVGGLATIGYLESVSTTIYHDLGTGLSEIHRATPANVIIGLLSSVIDNIPVMYAVLTMMPDMSHGQWLLVTLTAGIGGSLLSIGSAAGVALMGQAKGHYTFFTHLKWSWVILLGYAAGVWSHIVLNKHLFLLELN